jgi:hypothetical protein
MKTLFIFLLLSFVVPAFADNAQFNGNTLTTGTNSAGYFVGDARGLTNVPAAVVATNDPAGNPLASTTYVTGATNGFVLAGVTNGLASAAQVLASTNGLASTAYVNTATNGFWKPSDLRVYPFMFAVATNSVMLLTNTDMQVTWLNTLYSTNVSYTTNGGWTVSSDGVYELGGTLAFQIGSANPAVEELLYLNGSRYLVEQTTIPQNGSLPLTFKIFAHAGDNLKLYVWQNGVMNLAGNTTPAFQTFVSFTQIH